MAAHGRAMDADGAFNCLQSLLDSDELKPDGYTFGTLMGVAAVRGDLDAVQNIYRMSQEHGAERKCCDGGLHCQSSY